MAQYKFGDALYGCGLEILNRMKHLLYLILHFLIYPVMQLLLIPVHASYS